VASVDPVSLEVFRHRLSSVPETMGAALERSALSPNIRERRDFSCALFTPEGDLVAQAAHIPVHLGAMPAAVRAALTQGPLAPGDVVVLNDPFLGGTHLPDITMVSPVYEGPTLVGYLASRAHHADVGGMAPGSMPLSTEIYQEGMIIPPLKLREGGRLNEALLALICRNVRTPDERRADLLAQIAAHDVGAARLGEIARRTGIAALLAHAQALLDYAERFTRQVIAALPDGQYAFADYLDDDGQDPTPLPIRVTVTIAGDTLTADFTGSAPECLGCLNAVEAVTCSAVYYVVRCLTGETPPANAGAFRPIRVIAPPGTIVNARPPRAVAGGNVETSQRIVDVLLGALAQAAPDRIPAAGQGTMNNVALGGVVHGQPFAYYETIGGGMGASPQGDGLSGVHVHMSNTRNTPVEALEHVLPVRIRRYALRWGSGGAGRFRGGDGVVREYEFLVPTTVTLLTERRRFAPYGLQGGQPGARGENWLIRDGGETPLPGKVTLRLQPGDRLRIATPGGGGWGPPAGSA